MYKIASLENTDIPLVRKVAMTKKPVIISTGTATIAELNEVAREARDAGCKDLILLKCTSSYPADPAAMNLSTIFPLREKFHCHVGLSDHTLGIGVSVAACALGACMIEKHFTLSRKDGGVDSAFSIEPYEMKCLVQESKRAWASVGSVQYALTEDEKPSLAFRRSLYIVEDLRAGDTLRKENVKAIRPGLGLPTKYHDELIGRRIKRDVQRGTPLSWDLVS